MHQIGTNHPPTYLGELRNQEEIVVTYSFMHFFVCFPALNNMKLHLSIQKLFKREPYNHSPLKNNLENYHYYSAFGYLEKVSIKRPVLSFFQILEA